MQPRLLYNADQSATLHPVKNAPFNAQSGVRPAGSSAHFADLFCSRFRCTAAAYERRAFRELLYPHARLIAPVLRAIHPTWFAEDLKFIRDLGEATDRRDALSCAATFQSVNASKKSLLRAWLKIRVSGFQASLLAQRLFSQDG